MKKLLSVLLLGVTVFSVFAAGENVMREHRAIWMSSMLNSTWPGAAITESNAASSKSSLDKRIKGLAEQGINVLYFHTRINCDATYASSYEPYSSAVASSRGATPAYDPFEYFVEVCHKYGIEVYAWVNPYRYSQGGTYGAGERNYENSHPHWLLHGSSQTILNPGLPEVRQRVVDVCTEITTNYDIDGMIFDDYFYHSSIALSADNDLYNAYKSAGGTLSHEDWRRENVNMTIRDVQAAVKAARPYTVFAMGPAGRISPPNIGDYGLVEGPYGDMNYSGLYADPIHWLAEGWLDFLSPQVYWIEYFDKLTEWYSIAVPHFGRHLYTSVDCSRLPTGKAEEYLRQIDFMRSHVRANESGVVFFDLGGYLNYGERYNSTKRLTWGDILRNETFPNNALQPLHSWRGKLKHYTPGKVTRAGNVLSWAAASTDAEAGRYAVYAIPATMAHTDFAFQPEYLKAVVYTNSYDASAEPDLHYGVAVYDRYGRLGAFRFEGAEISDGIAPTNLSPGSGANAYDLCALSWKHEGNARYFVEIATDEAFNNVVGSAETTDDEISINNVISPESGVNYWWRVTAYAADHTAATSGATKVKAAPLAITAPAASSTNVSLTPVFTYTPCGQGTSYTLEIATANTFANIVHTAVTTEPTYSVPEYTLVSGKQYFARVTGTLGGITVTSDIHPFATADKTDYEAPTLITPASDGVTLNTNDAIVLSPWTGLTNVTVEISADSKFPARGSYKGTLNDFETSTPQLADIKIISKALVANTTYYVRAIGKYSTQGSTKLSSTEYSPVRTFVYSGQSGIDAPEVEASAYVDAAEVLHLPTLSAVQVYDVAGRLVLSNEPVNELSLSELAPGAYLIRTQGGTIKWVK